MKNLENYGIQEMNAAEIKNTDGGIAHYYEYGGSSGSSGGGGCIHENADLSSFPGDGNANHWLAIGNAIGHWLGCM